jgi:SdiA-regulated
VEESRLDVRHVFDVPLNEISGLGQRRVPRSRSLELLAVGDEEFTVVASTVEDDAVVRGFNSYRLDDLLDDADPDKGSQWEAADGDSTGRLYILQEDPAHVFVIGPDLDELLVDIELRFDSPAGAAFEGDPAPNSQGEGLVLLKTGHFLIAKEKDPPVLMEFGPVDTDPAGASPGLLFSVEGEFPLPRERRARFALLEVWSLDERAGSRISDISDVAVGPDNRLYILSDESRCIARLQAGLDPGDTRLTIESLWGLPQELQQPEGLVVTGDMTPIVAIDRKSRNANLFSLSPLGR